jgi:O-antigen/teichoic acid export membrane protein
VLSAHGRAAESVPEIGGGVRVFLKRTTWSFVDQAVVSLGTFLTNIFLARHLTVAEYGLFALLFGLSMVGQLLNYWLAAYPLAVRLVGLEQAACSRLSTSSILVVAALSVPLSGIVALVLFWLERPDLSLAGILCFLLWQIQQGTRRALLANFAHRKAVAGDVVTYLGQAVGIVLIAKLGSLSLENALYCMAALAGLGAVLQASRLPLATDGIHPPHRWLVENSSLGGWSLAAAALSAFRGYGLYWLVAALAGAAGVASLQAALNVFFVLNPIYFSLVNLIPQVAARALHNGDRRKAWRATRPYVLIVLPPIVLYLAFVLVFAPFVLWIFYGWGSPYLALDNLFPALAVFTAASIPAELIICYLVGIGAPRAAFNVNIIGFCLIAALSLPLITMSGVLQGACIALAAGDVVRLALLLIYLRTLTR